MVDFRARLGAGAVQFRPRIRCMRRVIHVQEPGIRDHGGNKPTIA